MVLNGARLLLNTVERNLACGFLLLLQYSGSMQSLFVCYILPPPVIYIEELKMTQFWRNKTEYLA